MHNIILFLLLSLTLACPAIAKDAQVCGPVQVFFSPHGGCTEAAVATIDQAKAMIIVQAYSFTSKPIADALVRAHARGVDVTAILDKSQETAKGALGEQLKAAGIPVRYDEVHRIAHNKVMVIDGEIVITGSFNFTGSAEDWNAENLLIIPSKDLAGVYSAQWMEHYGHSIEK